MIPSKIFGRLGNSLFQYAFLYAYARKNGLDFYFQDPKWFEEYADEIRELFCEPSLPISKVSIHVRRGKNPINPTEPAYAENPFYVDLCKTPYYQQATALFPEDTQFLVFSDDLPFCKKFFLGDRFEFSGGDEWGDLMLMASCEHNIIANSSYSWWGAFLNRNPHKKVVAPKAWYADGLERTVCPKEWTRI